MRSKLISYILLSGVVAASLTGCQNGNAANSNSLDVTQEEMAEFDEAKESEDNIEAKSQEKGEVTIIYTNDIHSYIANTKEDEDGNVSKLLSYDSVAALKSELEGLGKNVILVDAGDHVQGTAYGAMDEGFSIVEIMNATGYQVATLGNHEFDYGIFRTFEIIDSADYPYISCNFYDINEDKSVLDPYTIIDANGVKVAFVGITTPDTLHSCALSYFTDRDGNYLYDFRGADDGKQLYETVQAAIDEAKDKADYVVALGHLGVDQSSIPYTSKEVIENTTGLDAFIDGHSHTLIPEEIIKDASGNNVLLTQTGSYFGAIGQMDISAEGISTRLIEEYEDRDADIETLLDKTIFEIEDSLGEKIAATETKLWINDENSGERMVRRAETNLGDLIADSFYYYFNESEGIDCDIAIVNGGGVRTEIEPGDITYNNSKSVQPFGNVICLTKVSGLVLEDMLEWGAQYVGLVSDEGKPAEFGGFLQVAGLSMTINSSVESTVQASEDGMWTGSPTGEHKVTDIKIYNKETGAYEDIDYDKMYTVAGINYLLRNGGNGYTMFDDNNLVVDFVGEDYLIAAEYMKAFDDGDGNVVICTQNSPLNSYQGYLLDYENPMGSGRISIVSN